MKDVANVRGDGRLSVKQRITYVTLHPRIEKKCEGDSLQSM